MYSRNWQFINWKTFDAAFLHLPYQCVACLSAQLKKFHSCRHTLLTNCMLVCVCVLLARHQITFVCKSAAFLQTFFFCLPHGSNIARPATLPSHPRRHPFLLPRRSLTFLFPHPSGSIGCQTDRRAREPQITDTAFDRQQIYLNDMQIKLTSTKFRYFSFRFGALFSLCLLHSQW